MRFTFWLLTISAALFVQDSKPDPVAPNPNTPRPIEAIDSVFIEDMTWMEVRDALKDGKDTVLLATGGIEQNGPYLAANKHNLILRGTCNVIARKLGNALVAPIVGFVPEGKIDPPDSHMKYPSTVSVSEETYRALLTDICNCYRVHGFKEIILLGDSGGNQDGLKAVAEQLNEKWKGGKCVVRFIPEYFNYADVKKWLDDQGIRQEDEGLHDDFAISAMLLTVDPKAVRMRQRVAVGKFKINGVNLAPVDTSMQWGHRIIDFRANATVAAIRKAQGKE